MKKILLALALLGLAARTQAQTPTFFFDSVYAKGRISGVTVTPAAGQMVWVLNSAGRFTKTNIGTVGQCWMVLTSTTLGWNTCGGGGGGGSGTVTSVALALPSEFNVSGSPVTTAGTLTGAWTTQPAGTFFAGAAIGTSVPSFRAIVTRDITAALNWNAKGDLLSYDGSNFGPLAVGANGKILQADSTQTYGLGYSTRAFDANSFKITNLANGSSAQDAATFGQIPTGVQLVPTSPSDATKFLNGAVTPAFAQVKDSDLSTSNVTTNDVTIAKHGFAPILPNDASKFLNGVGGYTVPPGTGAGTVTSIATTVPITGGTITTTGTIGISIDTTNDGGAVAKQASSPGTQQTGHANLSGSIIAGTSVGAGLTTTPRTAVDVNGVVSVRRAAVSLSNGANNNLSLPGSGYVVITGPTGAFSITGIVPPTSGDGAFLDIVNSTAFQMTISNSSASSSVGNRINNLTGADLVLPTGTSAVRLVYDTTGSAWNVVSAYPATAAAGGGGGGASIYSTALGSEPAGSTGDLNYPTNGYGTNRYAGGVWGGTGNAYWGPQFPLTQPPIETSGVTTTINNVGGYTSGATSIVVTSSSGFPGTPFLAQIGTEDLKVTTVSGTTWTVTRGYNSTTAAAISNSATVTLINWEWVNQNGATVTQLPNQGQYLDGGTATSSFSEKIRKRLIGSNLTVVLAWLPQWGLGANAANMGFVLREAATAKITAFRAVINSGTGGYYITTATNATTFVANTLTNANFVTTPVFMKFEISGSSLFFYVGTDGQHWAKLNVTTNKTTFFTTGPDEWGYFVDSASTTIPAGITLLSWKESP